MDNHLIFENNRLYVEKDSHEKIDITDDVLKMFMRALDKQRQAAYQDAIVRQTCDC